MDSQVKQELDSLCPAPEMNRRAFVAGLLAAGDQPAGPAPRLASRTGGDDLVRRAHRIWKQTLAAYEPPPLDPAIAEELDAFIARRKEEGGVRTDY